MGVACAAVHDGKQHTSTHLCYWGTYSIMGVFHDTIFVWKSLEVSLFVYTHVILICIWYTQSHSDYQLFIVHVMQNSVITQLGYDISSEGPWKIHCNDNLWKILDYLIRSFGDLSNFMIICICFVFLKRSTIIALTMVYFWVLTNILINI